MSVLCRHFGTCGGCAHQDKPDADYRALKLALVREALAHHGVAATVEEVVEVPPATRRRATFKAKREADGARLGFHAAKTRDIVDMQECLVLTPALAGLVPRLREMLTAMLKPGEAAELRLTQTDTGADLGLRWKKPNDAPTIAALGRWAEKLKLARISAHGETVVELAKPQIRLGKATVALPPETFLQPTAEGVAALQSFACETLKGAKRAADLFAGCGTFSFALGEAMRVHAVEFEAAMLAAIAAAAKTTSGLKPVTTEKRNLFRRPLAEAELNAYDAVCLDPPRAGALEQSARLAKSKVAAIAYVSCNAETFARDARLLIDGGYSLKRLVPVDQFLWSNHTELAAAFVR